jgi:phenylacetate-CoA ligase
MSSIKMPDYQSMDGLRQRSWSWLLRYAILPAGDLAFGQGLMARLRFLEQAQWWDPERLAAYRDRALNSLLKVAYSEVPFYRDLLDRAGVTPDDIRRPGDLCSLPVVTKTLLRAGYPHLTTRSTGRKTHEACSSGSTGTNFRVKEDSETAGLHRASFLLALGWAGWRLGDPHLQAGITPERSLDRRLKDSFLRCHYVSARDLSDASLDKALDVLESHNIQHLFGFPGSLYCLAQRARQRGWNRPLRSMVTWGDNLYPHYRRIIQQTFAAHVFDTYGCGEGIQMSAQCGRSNTYHIHTPDVVVECADDSGRPVAAGQLGQLLLTRLHPGPMPLIRYQIGDVGVMGNGRLCECGRGYDIMESIQGRDTDIVMTPSGNHLVVHFFTGILEHFPEIESFQVVQEEIESIVLRIVPTREFGGGTAAKIVAALHDKGARDLRIDVDVVPEIPLAPSAKRRFVIAKPFRESRLQRESRAS